MARSFLVIFALFGAVLACANGHTLVRRSARSNPLLEHGRAIEGILDCGSQSEVEDTRYTGCDAVPCESAIGQSYLVEVEFSPHFDHRELRLSIILIQAPEHHEIIDQVVPDSAIEAGRSYTFSYTVRITGEFKNDALMAFNLVGDGVFGRDVICLGITLRVLEP